MIHGQWMLRSFRKVLGSHPVYGNNFNQSRIVTPCLYNSSGPDSVIVRGSVRTLTYRFVPPPRGTYTPGSTPRPPTHSYLKRVLLPSRTPPPLPVLGPRVQTSLTALRLPHFSLTSYCLHSSPSPVSLLVPHEGSSW